VVVYAEQGIYAGWPANHGAWQWDDELLVGFMRGAFKEKSMHCIEEPYELMQARSLDGGETWSVEPTGIPVETENLIAARAPAGFSLRDSIIRVRGVYDHGGDYVLPEGCFFASEDRGKSWAGPYAFVGLEEEFAEPQQCTARTRVLLQDDDQLVFLSRADRRMWGTDETFLAVHYDGRFYPRGIVCSDRARAVMPAVAAVDGRIVAVCRRRSHERKDGGWVEAFGSDDAGRNWKPLAEVGRTGLHNGNPPALAVSEGKLVCCYANRSNGEVIARTSEDRGESWSLPTVLRKTIFTDIGYPQLFLRGDGALVCVYYFADQERSQQYIAATIFTP
jgi:hypothetical protein